MTFDPHKILVIAFGRLGDVVMSLPALRAIRERFPHARITVAAGKPGAEVVEMSGSADATIVVDRISLRDGFRPLSILRILQAVKDVRRKQFDFVIDLHSLSETNLLGFLSGAPKRLFSRRPGSSLDFLANFDPPPPVQGDQRQRHPVDRYLDVLQPLGIKEVPRVPRLVTRVEDDRAVDAILRKARADIGAPLVGLCPGAGHASRSWPLERFAELADFLVRNDCVRVIVFVGPEERAIIPQIRVLFPPSAVILDKLTIRPLAAAFVRLAVFISDATGPTHVAAAVGVPIVLLLDRHAPESYIPLSEPKRVICRATIFEITVEQAYEATRELLATARTATLFAR